jgi:hypothetical protein
MTAYPQTSTALSPRLANFQFLQAAATEGQSSETRAMYTNKSLSESNGTPLRPQTSSSIVIGRAGDLSPNSPYRVMTGNSHMEVGSSSAMREVGLPPLGVPTNLSAIPGLQNNPTIIRTEGNVIYSTQPLTAADFGSVTLSGSGNLYPASSSIPTVQPSTAFSQFPPMNSFNPMPPMPFGPVSNGFFSSSPMTPRLLGPVQPLTPRGFPQMPFSSGQVGLTPRSFQTEQIMTSSIIPAPQPTDPALFMFAESFKNQCLAMQQYYATHPEELTESPRAAVVQDTRRGRAASSLHSIPDQENNEPENDMPSEEAIKKRDEDDVLDILNRLVGDEQPLEEQQFEDMKSPVPQPAPMAYHSPVVKRQPESFWKKFGCGNRA